MEKTLIFLMGLGLAWLLLGVLYLRALTRCHAEIRDLTGKLTKRERRRQPKEVKPA